MGPCTLRPTLSVTWKFQNPLSALSSRDNHKLRFNRVLAAAVPQRLVAIWTTAEVGVVPVFETGGHVFEEAVGAEDVATR